MLDRLTFMALRVKDMEAATRFFQDFLDLELDPKETAPGNYSQFTIPTVAGFALIHGLELAGAEQPYDLAFEVKEADAAHEKMKTRGVEIVEPPRDLPWGRSFLFRGPEGHILRAFSGKKKK